MRTAVSLKSGDTVKVGKSLFQVLGIIPQRSARIDVQAVSFDLAHYGLHVTFHFHDLDLVEVVED